MFNTATSDRLEVELVSIAEDVPITSQEMFDDAPETTETTLLFFHVTNVSDEPVDWWYDEHYFVDDAGFQYKHDPDVGGFEEPADEVPDYWYTHVEVQPGARARCVTAVGSFPADETLARVVYSFEGEHYELDVNRDQLGAPPL